jgi:hypothetical protein
MNTIHKQRKTTSNNTRKGDKTTTNPEKQTKGNIKSPELAARKLNELLQTMGVAPEETGGTITITGEDPFVASAHRIATTTAVSLSAIGATAATIWKMRTSRGY